MRPVYRTTLSAYIGILLTLLLSHSLLGQDLSPAASALTLPEGTPVPLRLVETTSSTHAHVGDPLKFVVTSDVEVDGRTVISAGNIASGTVIGVKHKRLLGIPGHVIFQLDSVALANGERIELNGRKEVRGKSHTRFMAAGIVGTSLIFWPVAPVFLLSRGSECFALSGTEVTGHVAGDVRLSVADFPPERTAPQIRDLMSFVPGRVLNGEGVQGDMVNLLFVAQPGDLQQAFQRGGWVKVDRSKLAIAWHLLQDVTHDAKLPMARLYLFGRVQDYSYALPDPTAVVTRRHHLRIWKTDYQINGVPVWAAAATHDVAIRLWKNGHIITHLIDPQVDAERDFISQNLTTTSLVTHQEYLAAAVPVLRAQTASGDAYYSDSRILLLDLGEPVTPKPSVLTKVDAVPIPQPTL